MNQVPTSEEIASELLKIEAIKLSPEQPFKWASGWDSPIYCDNRLSLSFPKVRDLIKNELIEVIRHEFSQVEVIAGVATAGIPQGVLIADALDLPFVYVRPKPKDHGLENLIEGKITPGQKILVVEDLISTGGSSLKAVKELKNAGAAILGMIAIFTYGFDIARQAFEKAGVKLVTLSDYITLIKVAAKQGRITSQDITSLEIWRKNPSNWGVV